MMKKVWALLLCALLMFTAACTGKPVNAGEKALAAGRRAVEIADEYLDMKIDAHEAQELLNALYDELDYVGDLPHDSPYKFGDLCISSDIFYLSTSILLDNEGSIKSYQDVLNNRNDLASEVGIKKR